jgi:hypothetical protein
VDCEEVREDLQALADNELSPNRRLDVISHLRGCAECADEFRRIGEFSSTMMRALAPLRPSDGFSSNVVEGVRESRLLVVPATVRGGAASKETVSALKLPSVAERLRDFLNRVGGSFSAFSRSPIFFPAAACLMVSIALPGGLWWFLSVREAPVLGSFVSGSGPARILRFQGGRWSESTEIFAFRSGDRIEAPNPLSAPVRLRLLVGDKPAAGVELLTPVIVQLEEREAHWMILPDASCRLRLSSNGIAEEKTRVRKMRFQADRAWVELRLDEDGELEAELSPAGLLTVRMLRGAAKLGNAESLATVAEGCEAQVPQIGAAGLTSK